jgi:hypothetical protein
MNLFLSPSAVATFDTVLSQEELSLAGHPTIRREMSGVGSPENPFGGSTYEYVIQLGATPESGPNFVGMVSSVRTTDYPAAKAALDVLMATWRQTTNQLVLRLDLFSEIPGYVLPVNVVVTADGRMVWLDEQRARLSVRRLTSDGLATLRSRLEQSGLFQADGAYMKEPLPGVTPPGRGGGYAQFAVMNRQGQLVTVMAAPIDADEADYWIITPERKALDDLRQELLTPEEWLPAGAWAERSSSAYLADVTTLILYSNPGAGVPAGKDAAEFGWVFQDPEHFGASADDPDVHKRGTIRCGVISAQDASLVAGQLGASGQLQRYPSELGALLPWSAGDGTLGVDLVAVRPNGSPDCSEVNG